LLRPVGECLTRRGGDDNDFGVAACLGQMRSRPRNKWNASRQARPT
jgi:hypothetical protein